MPEPGIELPRAPEVLWFVDTRSRLIEVRRLAAGKWLVEGVLSEEPAARIPPFEAIEIPLNRLWVD